MKKTDYRVMFDSSAWLSYFLEENMEVQNIFEQSGVILTSILSIFEIKRALKRRNIPDGRIDKAIAFMMHKSIISNLDFTIIEKAVEISIKEKLAAIDSLIYSSAILNNSILITGDADFSKLENVKILQ